MSTRTRILKALYNLATGHLILATLYAASAVLNDIKEQQAK
jgi:Tfp pilus assembly pilus retraction ATPase PilT